MESDFDFTRFSERRFDTADSARALVDSGQPDEQGKVSLLLEEITDYE